VSGNCAVVVFVCIFGSLSCYIVLTPSGPLQQPTHTQDLFLKLIKGLGHTENWNHTGLVMRPMEVSIVKSCTMAGNFPKLVLTEYFVHARLALTAHQVWFTSHGWVVAMIVGWTPPQCSGRQEQTKLVFSDSWMHMSVALLDRCLGYTGQKWGEEKW